MPPPDFQGALDTVFGDFTKDYPTVNLGNDDSPMMGAPDKQYFGRMLTDTIRNGETDSEGTTSPYSKYLGQLRDLGFISAGNREQIKNMPSNSSEGEGLTPAEVFGRGTGEPGGFYGSDEYFGPNDAFFYGSNSGKGLPLEGSGATWTPTDNYGNGFDAFTKTAKGFLDSPGTQLIRTGLGFTSGVNSGIDFFNGGVDIGDGFLPSGYDLPTGTALPDGFTGDDTDILNKSKVTGAAGSPDQLNVTDALQIRQNALDGTKLPGFGTDPNFSAPSALSPTFSSDVSNLIPSGGAPNATDPNDPDKVNNPTLTPAASMADVGTGAFDIGGSSGFGGSTPLSLDASVTGAESFPAGGGGGGMGDGESYVDPDDPDNLLKGGERAAPPERATTVNPNAPDGGAGQRPINDPNLAKAANDRIQSGGGITQAGKLPQSTADKALGLATKYGPAALGALASMQGKSAAKDAADKMRQIPATQQAIGNQLIQQYQSGKLNANDAAAIATFKQDAIAKSRAYFAKAGLSDSTQANEAEAQIAKQAEAMQSQMLQGYLTQGMTALNLTDQYQMAAVQAELQGSKDATKLASDFLSAYGSWMRGEKTMTGQDKT